MKYHIIPVTPFAQNCTLLWCETTKQAAVVDPGGDLEKVLALVEQEQLQLVMILLTHGHIDHVGGVAKLASSHSLPIYGPHKGDDFWLQGLAQQSQMFGFPESESFTPSRWLEQGDTIELGELTLQVLHCPGHCPGHIVFFEPVSQVAQGGDVLFQGSIGRTDFPGGEHATLIESITEKLLPLGDEVAVIPGHGPMTTIGEEKRSNPYLPR